MILTRVRISCLWYNVTMEKAKMFVYIPTLFMDLSCSPGGGDYDNDLAFLSMEGGQKRVNELQKELDKELGVDLPDDLTQHKDYKDWMDDMVEDQREKVDKDLTNDEVIEKYSLVDTFRDFLREELEDESDYEDYNGYSLSSPPHWYLKTVEIA